MPALFFPRRYPPLLRVAAFVLLSIVIAALSEKHPNMLNWSGNLTYPIHWLDLQATKNWRTVGEYLQDRRSLLAENAQLREKLKSLEPKLLENEILHNENRQLLALLDSFPQPPGRMAVAQVIAENFSPGSQLITVNLGSHNGVHVGQPVLAAGGVAGQVIHVADLSAQIALISDLDSSIPAQLAGTNLPLLVNGKGNIHWLSVPFQPRNTTLKAGDQLVTSGLGGRFPSGLHIGTISRVIHNGDEPFAQISVRPAVPLGQLTTVLILLKNKPTSRPDKA
ncbi:rod shape-determining protein MreC [Acidithiobacillus sp. HP-6]|uniref:rod shape-determining protein MreC n=1 Tax=Acidithiobacillus sp. HP-6 TaxID=2697655 RepID=UPI001879F02E|nr:rod shape-determining protein MreC [Acidithiobacillus sp. HP-6]MBE7563423.1 rod shape-determining protein MreC [Acidithiobacillus sp. HP-6]MBE7569636.1 rod shape-determining protein MreC [Acidithiobacillus sp. HP-2]